MARKLRPAVDIVNDIGALAFDLQHHRTEEIVRAVKGLRAVNPQTFDWVVRTLGAFSDADFAVDPVEGTGQEGATRAKESVLNAAISWKVKPR